MDELVVTSRLTKRFRRLLAVNELDLTVSKGDVFGFLGPNGAGKSTTLRMMVGLVRPSFGSVELFGHDVWSDRRSALKKVGALIEAPAFYKYLSGYDNIRILANTGGSYSRGQVEEALDIVGLLGRARDKVKTYSQGMRQRLGIALAVIGRPDLVLLDEPTNGLDPQGMKDVRELIARLSRELKMTVFLSSHLLHEVEQVCTRIAVINKGAVIESGRVTDLLSGSGGYEIRVDSTDKALSVLEGIGWAGVESTSDGTLNVKLTGGSSAELNRIMVERGLAVSSLVPKMTSLEELYLKLMDDGNGAADQV
ncbi:MAG: ABC transporter ATP-binding protein [Armatimonadetes bacterium]|nr:ABC transporter ATP-binding protein [Armatimonadota bacterium]